MRKVILGVLLGLGVAMFGLLVAVSMQPTHVHVERSRVMAAPPSVVWPLTSDLRAFNTWDPWSGRDPNQTVVYSDPSIGVGAWYTWKGNKDVGSGKMAITGIDPGRQVVEDLEFIEPFPSKAQVTLTLASVEGGTKVTWGFDTDNDLMGKAASLFMDMDAMLGPDFDKGLENLAGIAESQAVVLEAAAAAAREAAAQPLEEAAPADAQAEEPSPE